VTSFLEKKIEGTALRRSAREGPDPGRSVSVVRFGEKLEKQGGKRIAELSAIEVYCESFGPSIVKRPRLGPEDGADHPITGERAGSPTAIGVWPGAWVLGAAGLHAVLCGAVPGRKSAKDA
jgi:hypothetical protein